MGAAVIARRAPPVVEDPRRALGSLVAAAEANGYLNLDARAACTTAALLLGGVVGDETRITVHREECITQWRRVIARVRPDLFERAPRRLGASRVALLDAATELFVRALRTQEGA